MFKTPDWDFNSTSEKLSQQLFGHVTINRSNARKKKKKLIKTDNGKTTKGILSSSEVDRNSVNTIPKISKSKQKRMKCKLMMNKSRDKIKRFKLKKLKRLGTVSSDCKAAVTSYNLDTQLKPEKKRTHSFNMDTVTLKVKKKKQLDDSQDALLSPQNNVGFQRGHSTEKIIMNQNKRRHKKRREIKSTEVEHLLDNSEKQAESSIQQLPVKSTMNIKKLKQIFKTPGVSKRKRSLSSVSDTDECDSKKKKKENRKNVYQNELLLSEQHVENEMKVMKENAKKKRKRKKTKSTEALNVSNNQLAQTEKKLPSAQSKFDVKKLKEMLMASSNKYNPAKDTVPKKKEAKTETLRERMMKRLQASRFRYLNEQLYTSGGKDAKEYFQTDPDAFRAYHEGYQQQVRQWPINPLDIIIKSIKNMSPELIVADFGCGDARLAQSIPNKVHSFDLIAVSKGVTACDMAHTPLSSSSVDIAVFCLSLMGTSLNSYLIEANRVLKEGGILKIAEVESRFQDVDSFITMLQKFGFMNTWKDFTHNLFHFMDFKKEKCISKKMKKKIPELTLKPCLYKKR